MSNFKIKIKLSEEAIITDDKYEPEVLYQYIRDMYSRFHLPEIKSDDNTLFVFVDNGKDTDFGALMKATIDLYHSDWFKKYVIECTWYNYLTKEVEDFLAEARKYEHERRTNHV